MEGFIQQYRKPIEKKQKQHLNKTSRRLIQVAKNIFKADFKNYLCALYRTF